MSQQPGATAKNPVWTRETQGANDAVLAALDLATRIVGLCYMAMAAWQVAKILNPPLQVKQDMFVAAVKRRLAKPIEGLPELTNDDRAELYDFLRG